ncbi:MAG: Soluble lytic murein transglycosylase [Candidatus Frackibacter sp. T328-2]|jgi:soluble lytic murein transglycosylase-like protein|nr:MAG: Soluble lytic murein transglycosylase [Candidatus Frackibacter sp. T328-2]
MRSYLKAEVIFFILISLLVAGVMIGINEEIDNQILRLEKRIVEVEKDLSKFKSELIILKDMVDKSKYLRDIPLSEDLQLHTYLTARRYQVDYDLVLAVMFRESSYKITALNDNGNSKDYGLMQINNKYWAEEIENDLGYKYWRSNPYENIEAGVYILRQMHEKVMGEEEAVIAYHKGLSGFRELKSQGVVSIEYSRDVMKYRSELSEY